jgi:excisionase family DNA binding protein
MSQNLALLDKDDLRQVLKEVIDEVRSIAFQTHTGQSSIELLMTREEAAKALDVSLVTLNQWVKDGRVPQPKKIGKRVYFVRSGFADFLQSQEVYQIKSNHPKR